MSTMIERVARAISKADGENPDRVQLSPQGVALRVNWEDWVPHARAALTALLEPTEAMVKASWDHDYDICPEIQYVKMIQAALDEKEGV